MGLRGTRGSPSIRSDGRLGGDVVVLRTAPAAPDPPPDPPRRPWARARDAVIGKTVALNLVIGQSDKALWIPAVTAFPDGFEFRVELRGRLDEEEFGHPFFFAHRPRRRHRTPEEGLDPDLLRLGIQFSDGRKATNIESRMPFPIPGEPDEPPEGLCSFRVAGVVVTGVGLRISGSGRFRPKARSRSCVSGPSLRSRRPETRSTRPSYATPRPAPSSSGPTSRREATLAVGRPTLHSACCRLRRQVSRRNRPPQTRRLDLLYCVLCAAQTSCAARGRRPTAPTAQVLPRAGCETAARSNPLGA